MSAIDISHLGPEDKLYLLDELWAEMERAPLQLKLSMEQQQELDRRLDALEQEVASGLIWNEVLALARKGPAPDFAGPTSGFDVGVPG